MERDRFVRLQSKLSTTPFLKVQHHHSTGATPIHRFVGVCPRREMGTDVKRFVVHLTLTQAIFSWWVLLALTSPEVGGRSLSKFFLTDYSEAVCNDGSPASFYYSPSPNGLDQWTVYLEGGSFCENNQTCASRPEYYTTTNSTAYPKTLVGSDLFKSGSSSPFGDFHAVYVPYCTSDIHVGTRRAPLILPNKKNFYIRGGFVIESVFKELEKRGLNYNSTLVLAGTSAGALGALIHGIRFRQAGKYKHLAVIFDSAWFIDFDGIMGEIYSTVEYKDSLPEDICGRTAGPGSSVTCCLVPSCLIEEFTSSLNIPTFVISSRTDLFVLSTIINRSDTHPQFNFAKQKNSFPVQINLYTGAMNSSMASSSRSTVYMSLFQPGCGQHSYLRNNPFLTSRVEGSGRLSVPTMNDVTLEYVYQRMPGYWQGVTVNGISLSSSLAQWVKSNFSRQVVWESCNGFLCNPTCPDKIHTRLVQESYPEWSQSLILTVVIASLAVPIFFKVFLSIVSHRIRRSAALDPVENDDDTPWSRTGSKRWRFKSQRRFKAPILSKANSLMNLLKGNDLQLACRNLTVTVSMKAEVDESPQGKTTTDSSHCTKTILEDIEVQLHTNQLVGVMGPSGSGKTTFLHVLANRREGYTMQVRHDQLALFGLILLAFLFT